MTFSPSHGVASPFERLSDGQKSLPYISLVLAWQRLARRVLGGQETALDPDRLRPLVHTVIALEEPENSLAPQYLGRIIRQLRKAAEHGDVQALLATHAPTLLRRMGPESGAANIAKALRHDAATLSDDSNYSRSTSVADIPAVEPSSKTQERSDDAAGRPLW